MASLGCNKPIAEQVPDSIHRYVDDNLIDAELSRNAKLAVTLSRTRELSVWDNTSKALLHQWQAEDFDKPIYQVSLSANNKYLAVTGKHQVSIFDLNSGRLELSWLAQGFDTDASISSLYLNQSGKRILLGMSEGSVITIDLESNQLSMFQLHDGPVSHVEFISYDERILSAAHDGHALIWASSNGQVIGDFSLPQRISSISFDEADRRLFIADAIDNHLIADSHSAESVGQLAFLERYRYFRQALFTDRGKTLITASSKQKIMVWDISSGKEKKHWNISAFTAGTTVLDMVVSPSGQLITLSSDGALETWRLKSAEY
ncbi:WD40 repeat domain-containing protein [Shewanella sp. YLB-09]|nr:WD40 repeat domain-containing protein [Shewanella sp. YLB-09]